MIRYIVYTKEKGKIETDNWWDFIDLTWHREDGPALQEFYSGQLAIVKYYINGKRHRLDGPAYKDFFYDGKPSSETYYINDVWYTKSDYEAEIFKMNLSLL